MYQGSSGAVYPYPVVESVHVWALCVFLGMAIVLDLRLVGVIMRDVPVSQVARRLLPWTVGGFVVMLASGILLFYAIPVRTYQNIFFRAKLVMLVLAGINAWVFHATIWRRVASWDRDAVTPRAARLAGMASLVLWAGIVFAGRMIAYNCERAGLARAAAGRGHPCADDGARFAARRGSFRSSRRCIWSAWRSWAGPCWSSICVCWVSD